MWIKKKCGKTAECYSWHKWKCTVNSRKRLQNKNTSNSFDAVNKLQNYLIV